MPAQSQLRISALQQRFLKAAYRIRQRMGSLVLMILITGMCQKTTNFECRFIASGCFDRLHFIFDEDCVGYWHFSPRWNFHGITQPPTLWWNAHCMLQLNWRYRMKYDQNARKDDQCMEIAKGLIGQTCIIVHTTRNNQGTFFIVAI